MVRAKLLQLCPTLCDPIDCSPPGSSVHGVLQARILEWVAMSSSRGSSRPRDGTGVSYVSCINIWFFAISATWEALHNGGGQTVSVSLFFLSLELEVHRAGHQNK